MVSSLGNNTQIAQHNPGPKTIRATHNSLGYYCILHLNRFFHLQFWRKISLTFKILVKNKISVLQNGKLILTT